MNDKIYCIFWVDLDRSTILEGYVKGTEEDAKKYCEEVNKKKNPEYYWEMSEYEELKELKLSDI